MLIDNFNNLTAELDRCLEAKDLSKLQFFSEGADQRYMPLLANADLESLQSLTLSLTEHVQKRWSAVPAGYRELLGCVFDAVNQAINSDVEAFRNFADTISSQTDLNLPWHKVKLPRRGVAVLYNFVPFADTGASVASKRIRQLGAAVDVLSCSSIGKKATDFTPFRIARPYIRQATTLPVGPAWASWAPQYEFIRMALEEIDRRETSGTQYDFIYTRAMWVPSHYAGALRKLKEPSIEWIAEFSDPLSLDVEGLARAEHPPSKHDVFNSLINAFEDKFGQVPESQRGIFRMAELLSYAFADRIIFTNELQKRTMLDHIDNQKLRQRVIRHAEVSNHPTLPRPYYEVSDVALELDPEFIHLGYFGQFYATRGLGDITRAIRMLPSELSKRIKLHVFTTYVSEDTGGSRPAGMDRKLYESYVQRTIDALGSTGIENQIELHPALPYLDFLGVLDDFDYLLVNDANSGENHLVNPYLPSKYGDYIGAKSKIWALCENGSSLDTSYAHVKTPLGDANAVRRFLTDVLTVKDQCDAIASTD